MKPPEKKPPVHDRSKTADPAHQGQAKTRIPNAAQSASTLLLDDARIRGRPATGKRSNPEWKLYSHFLQKKTQRAAVAKLQAEEDGRDLSDVLQELLEGWLKA